MHAARAADGDGELRLARRLELMHEKIHEVIQLCQEIPRHRSRCDVLRDFLHAPARMLVFRDVKRIRQETDIDHHIGIDGDAILEAEGKDRDLHLLIRAVRTEPALHVLLEVGRLHRCRINDHIRLCAHAGKDLSLLLDAFLDTHILRERMLAARLHVAAHQRLIGGFQKDHLMRNAALFQLI